MTLEELIEKFEEIKKKGLTEGLTIEDYIILKNIRNELNSLINSSVGGYDYLNKGFLEYIKKMASKSALTHQDYLNFKDNLKVYDPQITAYYSQEKIRQQQEALCTEIHNLIQILYNKGLLHKFSKKDSDYIIENSYLLPLVLANNTFPKIKMSGDNFYMFLCQIHMEQTPSLGVNDLENYFFCFGCGYGGNIINYLKLKYDCNYSNALQLLSQIYLFDVKNEVSNYSDLVQHYQDAILSDEYQTLLEMGHDRLKKRHIEVINGKKIDDLYDDRFKTIERIRRKEYDPNFHYEGPKRVIRLVEDKF